MTPVSKEPTTRELPDLMLAGTCEFANFFANDQWPLIGETWHRLMQCSEKLPNRIHPERNFGLELYPSEFKQDRRWYYCACVEVASFTVDLPSSMLCRFIPAARYVQFTVQGNVTEIAPAFRYIYDEWLPNADVHIKGTYDLELYDKEFKGPCNSSSVTQILLPLA